MNLKLIASRIAVALLPQRAKKLQNDGMTLQIAGNLTRLERLMRISILADLEARKDYERLSDLHEQFWVNRGTEYFDATENNFDTVFLPDCSFLIKELRQFIGETHSYERIVEIGTGNGDVLNYMSEQFPEISTLIGLDLNENQVQMNRERYPNLGFETAEGLKWIKKNAQSNTIYLTSRGVLEYFTEESLGELLETASSEKPAIFVAIEPNGLDHDFSVQPHSTLYGLERSFSHNYQALFGKKFEIHHYSEKAYENHGHKLIFLLASAQ